MMDAGQLLDLLRAVGLPAESVRKSAGLYEVKTADGANDQDIAAIDAVIADLPKIEAKLAIKAKARAVILAQMPEWKQANATARAVELVSLGQASGAEWTALQAAWGWVKQVRAHSNELEAKVDVGQDVDLEGGWP